MGRVKNNNKGERVAARRQPSRAVKRKSPASEPDEEHSEKRLKLNTAAKKFQGLIRERKEEVKVKTIEKIKREMDVVDELKLGNEEDCLLQVFPKEIWVQILSSIRNPMDLANLWKVNPLFRDLLADSWIPKILLPQLLNNLLSNNLCHHDPWKYPASTFRRISKPLRNAVDKWYEDNLLFCLQGNEGHVPSFSVTFCKEEEKLDKTIKLFCSGPATFRAKRFFLRSFELTVNNWNSELSPGRTLNEHFMEFKTKILALLKVTGTQILHFSFKFFALGTFAKNGMPLPKICETFQHMVALMPNLKWLEIQFGFSSALSHFKRKSTVTSSSAPANWESQFPLLSNLERIDFRVSGKDCIQKFMILGPILRVNRHVKTLEMETIADDEATRRTIFQRLFESIYFLPVKLNGFHLRSCTELDVLQPLVQLNQGLKSLHLAFNSNLHGSLETAFKFVNNFPTLETLSMEIQNLNVGGTIPPLDLSNLRSFKITIVEQDINYATPGNVYFFYSLQFLLRSKKLRSLTWDNRSSEPNDYLHRFLINYEDPGDMINFKGGYCDLNYCNIWDVFPELERVKINMWITKNLQDSWNTTNREGNSVFVDKEYQRSEAAQSR